MIKHNNYNELGYVLKQLKKYNLLAWKWTVKCLQTGNHFVSVCMGQLQSKCRVFAFGSMHDNKPNIIRLFDCGLVMTYEDIELCQHWPNSTKPLPEVGPLLLTWFNFNPSMDK